MNNGEPLLNALLKNTQLIQTGIRGMLDSGMGSEMRLTLESRLREYNAIETEAHCLANQRGWELNELGPVLRIVTDLAARTQVTGKDPDARIAASMIHGSTRGMIRALEQIHRYHGQDMSVRILSQKLLDCERDNIRQMQAFL